VSCFTAEPRAQKKPYKTARGIVTKIGHNTSFIQNFLMGRQLRLAHFFNLKGENMSKTLKILLNLGIHLLWAGLGATYIIITLVKGHNPFVDYGNMEAAQSVWSFSILGNMIPAALFAISAFGVASLLHIPSTCGGKVEVLKIIFNIIASIIGIGLAIMIWNRDMLKPCEIFYGNDFSVFIVMAIITACAPFFLGWIFLDDERSNICAVKLLAISTIYAVLSAGVSLIVSAFNFVMYQHPDMAILLPILLVVGFLIIGAIGAPPVYAVYIFVVKKL
ncbi:MAG: hypothetical protein J6A96_05405, partial [Clostridia bacterium]|nr:hypothetical protein [Clostridia bacterium]